MELSLVRKWFSPESTIGELSVDSSFRGFTLELPKVDGKPGSCIPTGRFQVIITFSPKFQRDMPLLLGIPDRSNIRIHWGNEEKDTEGCILVGHIRGEDFVGKSRLAFDEVYPMIEGPARAGDCWITVSEEVIVSPPSPS